MCDYEEEPLPCAHCSGTGEVWLDDITSEECDRCYGTGWVD